MELAPPIIKVDWSLPYWLNDVPTGHSEVQSAEESPYVSFRVLFSRHSERNVVERRISTLVIQSLVSTSHSEPEGRRISLTVIQSETQWSEESHVNVYRDSSVVTLLLSDDIFYRDSSSLLLLLSDVVIYRDCHVGLCSPRNDELLTLAIFRCRSRWRFPRHSTNRSDLLIRLYLLLI